MSIGVSEASLSDIAAVTNGDGFGGGNGAWWLIILVLLFGRGYGFGGYGDNGGSSVKDQYVLSSDFATLQRMISDGNNIIERKLDNQNAGICDLGYTQAQLINGVNTNLMQGQFALSNNINDVAKAVNDCCCKTQASFADVNYNITNQANMIARDIDKGFCQTNYNMATQNTQTLQAIDRSTDRILERLTQDKMDALRDENSALRLAASQAAQTNCIVSRLNPTPVPAYQVPNPNCCYNACGC